MFPNAKSGVKKIFTSKMLEIIGYLMIIVSAVVAVILLAVIAKDVADAESLSSLSELIGANAGSFIPAIIIFCCAILVFIVAFILNITGLVKASKDDGAFKTALIAFFAGIIFSILSYAFSSNGMISSLMNVLDTVMDFIVFIYTVQGIRNLAVKLGDGEMDFKGNSIFRMVLIVIVLQFISEVIVMIFGGLQSALIIAFVFYIASQTFAIVQYIMFLSYLAKARKMLAC